MNAIEPQHTYALVVGIEKYKTGESANLDGPASNALDFVEWLSKRKVPERNIFLFISELNDNQSLVSNFKISSQKATRENIYKFITKTIPERGNNKNKGSLLYIYWGGHGIINANNDGEDRRLFYDDGEQNFSFKSLLQFLKSDIVEGFNQQILIVDACANFFNPSKKKLGNQEFDRGKIIKYRQQSILFATKEGYKSTNIDKEKTGLFSKVLLEELKKYPTLILPQDIIELRNNIKINFKANYDKEPIPTYYLNYVDYEGNKVDKEKLFFNQVSGDIQEFLKNEEKKETIKFISTSPIIEVIYNENHAITEQMQGLISHADNLLEELGILVDWKHQLCDRNSIFENIQIQENIDCLITIGTSNSQNSIKYFVDRYSIIFVGVTEPISSEIVKTMEADITRGNICGIAYPSMLDHLQILVELFKFQKVAFVYSSKYSQDTIAINQAVAAKYRLGVDLLALDLDNNELNNLFEQIKTCEVVFGWYGLHRNFKTIAQQSSRPVIAGNRRDFVQGALAEISTNDHKIGEIAAEHILIPYLSKELPLWSLEVIRAKVSNLSINLNVAKKFNLDIDTQTIQEKAIDLDLKIRFIS